jgi:hypothetical protein
VFEARRFAGFAAAVNVARRPSVVFTPLGAAILQHLNKRTSSSRIEMKVRWSKEFQALNIEKPLRVVACEENVELTLFVWVIMESLKLDAAADAPQPCQSQPPKFRPELSARFYTLL